MLKKSYTLFFYCTLFLSVYVYLKIQPSSEDCLDLSGQGAAGVVVVVVVVIHLGCQVLRNRKHDSFICPSSVQGARQGSQEMLKSTH